MMKWSFVCEGNTSLYTVDTFYNIMNNLSTD